VTGSPIRSRRSSASRDGRRSILLPAILLVGARLAEPGLPAQEPTAPGAAVGGGAAAESVEALVRRGNAARQARQIGVALAAYREAEKRAPGSYDVRLLIADTLRRSGRSGEAGSEYEAALRIDPLRHEAYAGQAMLLRGAYEYDGAASRLQAGLARVP